MENYRTFVGIPIKVDDKFLEARDKMMEMLAEERISWVNPGNYHVTLRFIGDINTNLVPDIGLALRKQVIIPGKTMVDFAYPGSFGPRKKPRVLWLGFEDSGIFHSMKSEVDNALVACGITVQKFAFRAHLTLGRVRSLKNRELFHASIDQMKDAFRYSVILEKLILYRSEMGSGTPVYTPLEIMDFKN